MTDSILYPENRTPAICGIAICGMTICGDVWRAVRPGPAYSDVAVIVRLISRDRESYVDNDRVIDGRITIADPFNNETAQVTIASSSIPSSASEIEIYLSKGYKTLIFYGKIERITGHIALKGESLLQITATNFLNSLGHKHLDEDWTIEKDTLPNVLDEVVTNSGKIGQSIDITGVENSIRVGAFGFEAWNETKLNILQTVISDLCSFYTIGTDAVIRDILEDVVYTFDNRTFGLLGIAPDITQADTYKLCVIHGAEDEEGNSVLYGPYMSTFSEGVKELILTNNNINTEWEAQELAYAELKRLNQYADAATVTIADFVYPKFGNAVINYKGLDFTNPIKSYDYEFDSKGIKTVIGVGRKEMKIEDMTRLLREKIQ